MERTAFEELVRKAIDDFPDHILKELKNVAVCVQDTPTQEQLRRIGTRQGELLLGLYEGLPEIVWGKGLGGTLPSKITVFQDSLEQCASSDESLAELVRGTVWHEFAHHVGFTDDDLDKMGK